MSWNAVDLSKLGDRPAAAPSLGDAGLLYPGKRHLLTGPPESAKTLFAYIVAIEVVRGGGTVALIDFEMGPWDARDRLRELGASDEELSRGVAYREPETVATATTMSDVIDDGPTLVVIDASAGAYGVQGLDDNKRKDVEEWAATWTGPPWQAGIATLVIDHVVKNSDSRGMYAIGSERKVGGVDVRLGFEPITLLRRGGRGIYRITTHRDRAGHLPRPRAGELELVSDPETHAISWTYRPPTDEIAQSGDGFRPTFLMDRVLQRVSESSYVPLTRSALANDVTGNRKFVLQAIECLLDDGLVALDGKKVVPVPRNVPGTFPSSEGNGNVPRSSSLEEERFSGTESGAVDPGAGS